MHVSINLDDCWKADERVRLRKLFSAYQLRIKIRKNLLDELDREIPEYPRPLWKAPKSKIRKSIFYYLKYLIP